MVDIGSYGERREKMNVEKTDYEKIKEECQRVIKQAQITLEMNEEILKFVTKKLEKFK